MNITQRLTADLGAFVAPWVHFDILKPIVNIVSTYTSSTTWNMWSSHIHRYLRSSDTKTRFLPVLTIVLLGTNVVMLAMVYTIGFLNQLDYISELSVSQHIEVR